MAMAMAMVMVMVMVMVKVVSMPILILRVRSTVRAVAVAVVNVLLVIATILLVTGATLALNTCTAYTNWEFPHKSTQPGVDGVSCSDTLNASFCCSDICYDVKS